MNSQNQYELIAALCMLPLVVSLAFTGIFQSISRLDRSNWPWPETRRIDWIVSWIMGAIGSGLVFLVYWTL